MTSSQPESWPRLGLHSVSVVQYHVDGNCYLSSFDNLIGWQAVVFTGKERFARADYSDAVCIAPTDMG